MWPSIAQHVVEALVPHITPAVARVFNKSSGSSAPPDALLQSTDSLREELRQATASHDSLYRQLNEHADKLSTIASDTHSIKLQTASIEDRLHNLERRASGQQKLVITALALLAASVVLLLVLLLRHL